MKEGKDARRKMALENGEEIFTRSPTLVETQEADWEYSRVFNNAIAAGLPTRSMQLKRLRNLGLWTESNEKEVQTLRDELNNLIVEVEEGQSEERTEAELLAFAEKADAIKGAIGRATQELESFMAHTAEHKAEDARIFYLAFLATENKDGSKVWDSFEKFKLERDQDKFYKAIIQLMMLQRGAPEEDGEKVAETAIAIAEDAKAKE